MIALIGCSAAALADDTRVVKLDPNDKAFFEKSLPDMDMKYDTRVVKFDRASPQQIRAAVNGRDMFWEVGRDGRSHFTQIDLSTVPYWLYATYDDRPRGGCQYALVDGFFRDVVPETDRDEPVSEPGRWVDGDYGAVVLRNCGAGYGIVSLEGFDGIFDDPRKVISKSGETLPDGVAVGMAGNYVERLIAAFGGREAVQDKFDSDPGHDFRSARPVIASELKRRGFRP
ncbi:MAG: hypothetical protein FWD68_03135 [Alphaproteobacteria bacterium]|nr:hypothetical protein [Alphaproteobacteria bacterium]